MEKDRTLRKTVSDRREGRAPQITRERRETQVSPGQTKLYEKTYPRAMEVVASMEERAEMSPDYALGERIAAGRALFKAEQAAGRVPDGYEGEIWGTDAIAARNELVLSYDNLVHMASYRLRERGIDRKDLEQQGRLLLLRAAERFDPKIVPEFGPYANKFVSGELLKMVQRKASLAPLNRSALDMHTRYLQEKDKLERAEGRDAGSYELAVILAAEMYEKEHGEPPSEADLPKAIKLAQRNIKLIELGDHVDSLNWVYEDTDASLNERLVDPQDVAALGSERGLLREAFAVISDGETLNENQQKALLLSLRGDLSQEAIAAEVGVSQPQVSKLISQARKKIREKLHVTAEDLN